MSRFINRVHGADEASIAVLKKQNAEMVGALRASERELSLGSRAAALRIIKRTLAQIGCANIRATTAPFAQPQKLSRKIGGEA